MSASRQARRQLGRSLKALGKAPLCVVEIFDFDEEISLTAEDVRLAAGRCAACPSTSGERKSCHACSFVRYCNRECQTAGWPSHKLVCRVLAADREIVSATQLTESAPLLPLDILWERLRSGSHSEAIEATAHLRIWADRCESDFQSRSVSTVGPGHISALADEISASDGIALLVKGLAAGGLRAVVAAGVLVSLVLLCPEMAAAIFAADALPPLIYAIALPSKNDLGRVWSILAAADTAAQLVDVLGASSAGRPWAPAIVEAGGVPVLVDYLTFVMRDEPWSESFLRAGPHYPVSVRSRAISAISNLFTREDTGKAFKASTARACIASGAPPPLLTALGVDTKTAGYASLCLGNIVKHSEDCALAATLVKDHASHIVAVLAGDSDDVENCAFLLQVVLVSAPETRAVVVAAGALRPLVALLSADGANETSAASALGTLCVGDSAHVDAAFAEGALEPLLALMKLPNAHTRERAVWALSAMLTASEKREHKDRALAGGAIRILAECLAAVASTGEPNLANSAAAALATFFAAGEGGGVHPFHASIVDQILEAIPLSRLVKMIGDQKASFTILRLLSGIAASPDRHGALVGAKLPRALVAALASNESSPAARDLGLQYVPKVQALGLLGKLLRGPEAANGADAFLAANGLLALANALGERGKLAHAATTCLLAISELGERRRAALVAAGAVPRLLALFAADEGEKGPELAKLAAAHTLLNLIKADASVMAEAAAAGFDAARLRQLAGLPDDPAAPASA